MNQSEKRTQPSDYAAKLAKAKEWLGTRWILHPANKISRKTPKASHAH